MSTSVTVPSGCQKAATYQLTGLTPGSVCRLAGRREWTAQAQEAPVAQEAQAQRHHVRSSIASQPWRSALMTFGRQAGLQVAVDPSAVANRTSAAVRGSMTVDQALQQLLAGSGLMFQYTGSSSVQIRAGVSAPGAITLDPVQVQGVFPVPSQAMIDNIPPAYAGGQVTTGGRLGLLGNRDVMETPFNQTELHRQEGAGPAGADHPRRADRRSVGAHRPADRQQRRAEHDDPRLHRREHGYRLWRALRPAADLFSGCRTRRTHRGAEGTERDAERHGAQRCDRRHHQRGAQARPRRADDPGDDRL